MSEQRGTHANEDVRSQPGGFRLKLSLEADRAPEDNGERELAEHLELKDLNHLRRGRLTGGGRRGNLSD
jgi:hypothetical protein